jgi:hypothetical protein
MVALRALPRRAPHLLFGNPVEDVGKVCLRGHSGSIRAQRSGQTGLDETEMRSVQPHRRHRRPAEVWQGGLNMAPGEARS